jgi:hypothetical protein
MANSDKNILITPNRGANTDPKIDFVGANANVGPQTITMSVYPDSNGTLSWAGSAGQLFSITNDLTGTIFSVNDISGIPSIEVYANGNISMAEFSGNVGIGTTSATSKLTVNGEVSATDFNSTSDRTLKENFLPIENALDKVMKLSGWTYNFKSDTNKKRHAGLVAQDLLEVLPEAVTGEPGNYRVAYNNIIGLLIEAIKEQQEQIEELKRINKE